MRKHIVVLGVAIVGLAAFAVFAGWAFVEGSQLGGGWRSLGPIWPYVVGGVLIVAALAGFLMWLAFYSANHGYDEPYDVDRE
jgi:4-hydroxybenzoate polyprenyltransferase